MGVGTTTSHRSTTHRRLSYLLEGEWYCILDQLNGSVAILLDGPARGSLFLVVEQ